MGEKAKKLQDCFGEKVTKSDFMFKTKNSKNSFKATEMWHAQPFEMKTTVVKQQTQNVKTGK